ncbi:Sil1p KNAG_0L00600 [Huiozyma naganishii CBS 8797]|uniref:Nucleotide exchange factor SIL1 n=1 Tax=Huiozyma naganishii (strain ATCC MYA-139 / BCRC 22969 / CBS 8797 / KCTC 17520 / NBRC 10181 / NCYC 3082 / Yp74L-3) TaxID=1071383 RepID=J7RS17_HUIN7|nr:hypothetical protein KNAG_0L00600 [Kazachstania naganishii CBS 8797]CCK72683.1 hypothetical protein KNAG_0L00600 [Kazachstania naganishii CBS 8797]
MRLPLLLQLLPVFTRAVRAQGELNGLILAEQNDNTKDELNEDGTVRVPADLEIRGSLVCSKDTNDCYPREFEPQAVWQPVKRLQMLPAGLDIRMNLETGLKEAKWRESEPQEAPEPQEYELTGEFKEITASLISEDYTAAERQLQEVLDLAHDYKIGYKIVAHDFALLRNVSLDLMYPDSLREAAASCILSSVRNNPPAREHILEFFPEFTDDTFEAIAGLSPKQTVLMKRYLSTLEELLPQHHDFTGAQMSILDKAVSQMDDIHTNIRVLQLASKYLDHIDKNSVISQKELQGWTDRLVALIGNDRVDELHVRRFFDSLYNMKRHFPHDLHIGPGFQSWLLEQAGKRSANLKSDLHQRDLEQDEFDQKLVDSRFSVFGNKLAKRIKADEYRDEL